MKKYDYIIAGAGGAGLSLAYHLCRAGLQQKSVLLIDQDTKDQNDRTWCFWEAGKNPFEPIVYRKWSKAHFYGSDFHALLNLSPYQYKMIRGIDFYAFVKDELRKHPGVEWAFEGIESIEDTGTGAKVSTDRGVYLADWVFDSTYSPRMNLPRYHNLLQHFKGWEIEVDRPTFNPDEATLMDFRIEQHGEARFFYVLPLDERRALVEFTVFSASLLLPEAYDTELKTYLASYLRLKDYQIIHQEFGVIPMTDEPLTAHPSRHVVRIGTAGGNTKPSTGYTFLRIQQHTQALVKFIQETGKPFYAEKPFYFRFGLYDSILLNVIGEGRCETRKVFSQLFEKNKASAVFQFLDETTTFPQELKIMTSVPSLPFVKAVGDVLWKKIRT